MDTAALQNSRDKVASSGDEVPLYFYSHLFLSHPELRSMFPISMSAQRDRLVGALGRVVSNVDRLDQVTGFVQQLGRDHRRFSVVPEHYNAVGASLLATLQHFLGAAWTEPLASDWAAAYGVVARIMVEAAEESADEPAWWDAAVVSVDRRSVDVSVIQLRPTRPLAYLPGQSLAMEIPQRPRLWRYYSPANAPRQDGTLELHVQLVDGGQVSAPLVRSVRAGDEVRLGAPVGDQLTRAEGDERDLVMIAGGTGLAPLRAVVEQVDREWTARGRGPHVRLYHGARVPWNLYDRGLLRDLAAARPWFDYVEVVSDDPSFPGARGPVGTVAVAGQQFDGQQVLVCGGPGMIAHTLGELADAGVPADAIGYEQFHHVGAGDVDDPVDETLNEGSEQR